MTATSRIRKPFAIAALALGVAMAAVIGGTRPAAAKGCWEGILVGAIVGHLAGHHAILGAVAGCAIGKIAYGDWQKYKVDHPDVTFKQYLAANKDKYREMLTSYAGGKATVEGGGSETASPPQSQ
jgi:hypothetical protein